MTRDSSPAMQGPTKFFFEDENVDRMFGMILALGAEITKVDEKLDTVLRLLERSNLLDDGAVRNFEATPEEQAARDAVRKTFIETLLAPFQMEADALVARARSKA